MRVVTFNQYGAPSVLELGELEKPTPGPEDVLIRVGAVEVTKSDCELRAMRFPVRWFAWPMRLFFGWSKPKKRVLGGYLSGIIEAVGERVTQWRIGDEVFGSSGMRHRATYRRSRHRGDGARLNAEELCLAQAALRRGGPLAAFVWFVSLQPAFTLRGVVRGAAGVRCITSAHHVSASPGSARQR